MLEAEMQSLLNADSALMSSGSRRKLSSYSLLQLSFAYHSGESFLAFHSGESFLAFHSGESFLAFHSAESFLAFHSGESFLAFHSGESFLAFHSGKRRKSKECYVLNCSLNCNRFVLFINWQQIIKKTDFNSVHGFFLSDSNLNVCTIFVFIGVLVCCIDTLGRDDLPHPAVRHLAPFLSLALTEAVQQCGAAQQQQPSTAQQLDAASAQQQSDAAELQQVDALRHYGRFQSFTRWHRMQSFSFIH